MIIIDTHVLVWLVSTPNKLSKKALEAIGKEHADGTILISTISVWEIYMLVKKGRLKLSIDIDSWIDKVENLPLFQFVPVDNRISAKSVNLPGEFHKDPADRIIVATARSMGLVLVTSDARILNYKHVQSIW